jgi:hypothetical protein
MYFKNKSNIEESLLSKKRQNKIIPICIVVSISIFIIAIILLSNSNTTTEPKYDSEGNPIYVASSKVDFIYSNPESYYGQFVDLTGKVFSELEKNDGYIGFQMFADPENSEKNTVIYYNGSTNIKTDDYIKVTGYVYDTFTGANAFGGTISAPVIIATNVEKSSYIEVNVPTLKEVNYTDKIINQKGYTLEVTKVEFAERETRVYLKATNNAKDDFSIYTYSALITQENKQYEQESVWEEEYDELLSELKPGISDFGVLVFQAINQNDFKLIIEGSSDNWDIDIDEYTFNLNVK